MKRCGKILHKEYNMIKTTILFFMFSAFLFAGNIYYSDNQNTGAGDGSFSNPFQTISTGMNALHAGDTLFVRGTQSGAAQIYNENLSLSDSDPNGTEAEPIVVMNYQNEKVRIILGGSFSVYTDWWQFIGLHFDANQNTSDAIKPKGNHLTFRDCEISNGQRDGFDTNRTDYLLIENCTIHNFDRTDQYDAHGIILNGGHNNTIRGNTIYDCKGDCIQLYKADPNYDTLIEDNDLYTTMGSGSENAIDIKGTQGCTIRNNKMHGFHDAEDSDGVALKINKNSDDILVEKNDIYESNGGIRISGGEMERITIQFNVIHDLHVDGGDSSKYGYGVQFDGVNDVEFKNNTFAHIPGPLFWIASGGATNLNMKNNLFYDSNSFKGSVSDFNGTVTIDYNGWFSCTETISGPHDTNGSNPQFTNEAEQDYHLHTGSPAIDKGDPAEGTEFPGGRIDLGAFEYSEATSAIPPRKNYVDNFRLEQNYPNPFNPTTAIRYRLSAAGFVELAVYNVLGQKIRTLVNRIQKAGVYNIAFDGALLPSGIYFYRLTAGSFSQMREMALLR